jgi:hypothetical protein
METKVRDDGTKLFKISDEALREIAKRSCRKCHGRGYIGWDSHGNKVLCSCVRPGLFAMVKGGKL